MIDVAERTASPRLRRMFGVAAAIMLGLWAWSFVPPIQNWGNPNEDGFSYVPIFYTTITCLPVGLFLLIGRLPAADEMLRAHASHFFSLP